MISYVPQTRTIWQRPNSGVFLQERYEIQILDSFGIVERQHDCGVLYAQVTPEDQHVLPAADLADLRHRLHGRPLRRRGQEDQARPLHGQVQRRDDPRRRGDQGTRRPAAFRRARSPAAFTSRSTASRRSSRTFGSWTSGRSKLPLWKLSQVSIPASSPRAPRPV